MGGQNEKTPATEGAANGVTNGDATMVTTTTTTTMDSAPYASAQPHPLDPLTAAEIRAARDAVVAHLADVHGLSAPRFCHISLHEGAPPPAARTHPEAGGGGGGGGGGSGSNGTRLAEVLVHLPPAVPHAVRVRLPQGGGGGGGGARVVSDHQLPPTTQPALTPDDCALAECVVRGDPRVARLLRAHYGLEDLTRLVCDPWSVHMADDPVPGAYVLRRELDLQNSSPSSPASSPSPPLPGNGAAEGHKHNHDTCTTPSTTTTKTTIKSTSKPNTKTESDVAAGSTTTTSTATTTVTATAEEGADRERDRDEEGADLVRSGPRLVQTFLYYKLSGAGDAYNHYAHPLHLLPLVDLSTRRVILIDGEHRPNPPPLPTAGVNYHDGGLHANAYLPTKVEKRGLRPLEVVQPEGASFRLEGHHLEWERWALRIGFNHREGVVLHDVRYAGRPVLRRASVAEMAVPYADPRPPFHRKCAFDVGDYGLGYCANSLRLGCDCVGEVAYLNATLADAAGLPYVIENAICVHEEDAGILHKHVEYRSGEAFSRRARRLVVSFVATVVNYEYLFYWWLHLDGSVGLDVRLSGMLSTNALGEDELAAGGIPTHGTLVAPGVNAQLHQHMFCARIEPAVDGAFNRVSEVDVLPAMEPDSSPRAAACCCSSSSFSPFVPPVPTSTSTSTSTSISTSTSTPAPATKPATAPAQAQVPSSSSSSSLPPPPSPVPAAPNWTRYGNAFCVSETLLRSEREAQRDGAPGRSWRIANADVTNAVSRTPVAYRLVPRGGQPALLTARGSAVSRRARFAERALWVTRWREGERFPAGEFPTQAVPTHGSGGDCLVHHPGCSRRGGEGGGVLEGDGVQRWAFTHDAPIVDQRLVLWHSFGVAHIPRTEDFPIMPCEDTGFVLRPDNFFLGNPAVGLDAVPSTRSVCCS